jgi:hypothetical protein
MRGRREPSRGVWYLSSMDSVSQADGASHHLLRKWPGSGSVSSQRWWGVVLLWLD